MAASALLIAGGVTAISGTIGPVAPAEARYASNGTGLYPGSIDWIEWGAAGATITNGATAVSTRTIGGIALTTTCRASNVSGAIMAYRSGSWQGDALDNLYNIGSQGGANQLIAGLANMTTATTVSLNFECAATLGGAPVPLRGLVVADAEASSAVGGEYVRATPNQANVTWRVIDRARDCATSTIADRTAGNTLTLRPDGAECTALQTGGFGPMAVAFMEGATGAQATIKGGGRSAIALGVVLEADFGDAPASYGDAGALFERSWNGGSVPVGSTNVSGAGFALATNGQPATRLGATVDSDSSSLYSAGATGDDTTGVDDEDAIGALAPVVLNPGDSYTIPNVQCTGPGFVSAWLDWNRNGAFDAGERSGPLECQGGSVAPSWTVPDDVSYGPSFVRMRIAEGAGDVASPIGMTTTGEVEDHAITLQAPVVSLSLQKTSDAGFDPIVLGQTITYSFLLTNTGQTPLSDVRVEEQFFTGSGSMSAIDCPTDVLAIGASTTCSATYTVTQADVDAGTLENTAVAFGTPPVGAEVPSAPSSTTAPADPAPALTIVKSASPDGPETYEVGQEVTYSFLVTNTGNVTLTNVSPVEDTFTGTGTFGPITPAPVTLAPSESAAFSASYTLTQADVDAGSVTNTATATGTPPPGGGSLPPVPPSEVTVPTPAAPGLSIVKTADLTEITAAGQTITYSFDVTNTGNVTLTDVVPVEGAFTGTGTLSAFSPASVTLAPGVDQVFTATYVVTQADIDAGGVTNTATATGTPPLGSDGLPPVPPSEVTVPSSPAPSLQVDKTADLTEITAAGQTITYSFDVTNTGNVTLTDVVPVEGAFTGTGTLSAFSPASVTLAPGVDQVFTATYVVTQADIDAGGVTNTATATGTPPLGSDGLPPVPPSEVTVPSDPTPGLSIVKSASPLDAASFVVGEEITYSFVVTNTGNVTLSGVAPVEGAFTGTGELGPITPGPVTLAPQAQQVFTATYVVTQADFDAGGVTNTATATGTPPGGELPPVPPSEVTVPSDPTPGLSIVKSADLAEVTAAGQTITYSFDVTNTGNVTLTDVVPVEGAFTGTGELGEITPAALTLVPGQIATFTAEYTVTQADIDAGGVTNTATATGTPPPGSDGLPPVPPSEVTVPADPAPGLSIVKSASPLDAASFVVGEEITYSFVVTNTGNVTLSGVAPVEGAFTGSGSFGPITPGPVTLAPQAQQVFTATYVVTQADFDAGGVTNTATATGTPPGGVLPPVPPSEVTVPSAPAPSLAVVKTADLAEITAAGQTITYSFEVTNTGNVTLTDAVPVEGAFTGTGELGEITPAAVTLIPGQIATFTATYVVTQADVDAGGVTNTATATGTPPPGSDGLPPVPPSEVTVPADPTPGLSIIKTADLTEISAAGETITYTFLVTNTGNVTLMDVVPVEGAFTGAGELSGFTPDAAVLVPRDSEVFTATYVVTQADVDAGGVTNTATATGTPPPGGGDLPPVPPSEVTVPADPAPGLSIVKTADVEQISAAGQTVTYSFEVSNTGNVTLTDVVPVEGAFTGTGELSGFSPASATLAGGASTTFTATYVVTQADVDAGGVTNTATATGTPPPGGGDLPPVPPSEVTVPADPAPGLSIVKSASVADRDLFVAGEVVTYSFVVTNTGTVTLTNVTPVEGDFTGTGDLGPITPAPVTLAPGAQQVFTAQYTLTQADIDAGSVENTATATSTPPPGGGDLPPVPPSEAVVPTPPAPSLTVVKTADLEEIVEAGQVITYSFLVTNTGNVTLADVVPVEGAFSGTGDLGPIAPGPVALLPGQAATFTAEYTITQADVDAGGVTNTATATGTPPPGGPDLPPVPPSEVTIPATPGPGLSVVKTADTQRVTRVGQVVTYSFVVTNTGNMTMTDVTPVEQQFSGTGQLGPITPAPLTLEPGESATFTAQYTATRGDADHAELTNSAIAVGTPPTGGQFETPPSDVRIVLDIPPASDLAGTGPEGIAFGAGAALLLLITGLALVRRRRQRNA